MNYKFKINKDLLDQFFISSNPPTIAQLEEVYKLINVVLIKHFSSFQHLFEDLRSFAILSALEHRDSYDPSFSSYNYLYSIFRNEIGNKINKITKEFLTDDLTPYKRNVSFDYIELPPEISKYKEYLTAEKDFVLLRIPKKDVLNLILFVSIHQSSRMCNVPEFLEPSEKTVRILYKLLKDKFNGE